MRKNRKIFLGCVSISLFFHVLALLFLQRYSLWFFSAQKGSQPAISATQMEKRQKDQILQTAFSLEGDPLAKDQQTVYSPEKEMESLAKAPLPFSLPSSEQEPFPLSFFQHAYPPNELVAFTLLPTFSIPSDPLNLLEHLPKDLVIPTPSGRRSAQFPPLPELTKPEVVAAPPPLPQAPELNPVPLASGKIESPLTAKSKMAQPPSLIPLPTLPHLPTLAELDTASYSDSFETELVFVPREEGKGGYIFALTLIPRANLKLPKIRQHFTFLIDRSNSIQQERLNATKSAIHKVLAELSAEDTFNIIAFDSKIEKLSPIPLSCTPLSLAQAEPFLEKLQLGSFFSSSDLYRPLLLTVPGKVENDEIHTAILLTDGETLAKKQAPKALLKDWTQYNGGKVTLYVLGMNTDTHFATLDTAAFLNKGRLSTAPTSRGIKRKLLKLMKTIREPVAKNLSCQAIHLSPESRIELYPKAHQAPPLYLDQPYVILGETETLDDFILFVQGKLRDRWLNIKKNISFIQAKKGGKALRREWALQKAYMLYEKYLQTDLPQHLVEANALLEPFDLPTAFR